MKSEGGSMSAPARARTIILIVAGFIGGVSATFGLGLGSRVHAISFWGEESTPKAAPTPPAAGAAIAPQPPAVINGLPDFATLSERLSPTMVNISTSSSGSESQSPFGQRPFGGPGGP